MYTTAGVPSSLASSPAFFQPGAEQPGERLRDVLGIGLPGRSRTAGARLVQARAGTCPTTPDDPVLGRVEGRRLLSFGRKAQMSLACSTQSGMRVPATFGQTDSLESR
ncbi:hypothetical protein NEUTE2DRAFT_129398 [Neurospora tetrasperma FGSC 2509]|nr:hypothetical protein NEUTE2DRAFT_129398 [Neurospora tetrasperma FGSC 2509]